MTNETPPRSNSYVEKIKNIETPIAKRFREFSPKEQVEIDATIFSMVAPGSLKFIESEEDADMLIGKVRQMLAMDAYIDRGTANEGRRKLIREIIADIEKLST